MAFLYILAFLLLLTTPTLSQTEAPEEVTEAPEEVTEAPEAAPTEAPEEPPTAAPTTAAEPPANQSQALYFDCLAVPNSYTATIQTTLDLSNTGGGISVVGCNITNFTCGYTNSSPYPACTFSFSFNCPPGFKRAYEETQLTSTTIAGLQAAAAAAVAARANADLSTTIYRPTDIYFSSSFNAAFSGFGVTPPVEAPTAAPEEPATAAPEEPATTQAPTQGSPPTTSPGTALVGGLFMSLVACLLAFFLNQ